MKLKVYMVLAEHGGVTEVCCVTAVERDAIDQYHALIVGDFRPAEDQDAAADESGVEMINGTWYWTCDDENSYRLEDADIEVPVVAELLGTLEAISNDCHRFVDNETDIDVVELLLCIRDACDKHLPRTEEPAESEPTLQEKGDAIYEADKAGKCEGCDGSGIRPDSGANDSTPPDGFTFVERCDTCQRYPDDLAAAKAWGDDASEFGRFVIARQKGAC